MAHCVCIGSGISSVHLQWHVGAAAWALAHWHCLVGLAALVLLLLLMHWSACASVKITPSVEGVLPKLALGFQMALQVGFYM